MSPQCPCGILAAVPIPWRKSQMMEGMLGMIVIALVSCSAYAAPIHSDSAAFNLSKVPQHTVSGMSSGGDMSVMHFVVYSSLAQAVGVVAGAPYGCNVLADDEDVCGTPAPYQLPLNSVKMNAYLEVSLDCLEASLT